MLLYSRSESKLDSRLRCSLLRSPQSCLTPFRPKSAFTGRREVVRRLATRGWKRKYNMPERVSFGPARRQNSKNSGSGVPWRKFWVGYHARSTPAILSGFLSFQVVGKFPLARRTQNFYSIFHPPVGGLGHINKHNPESSTLRKTSRAESLDGN